MVEKNEIELMKIVSRFKKFENFKQEELLKIIRFSSYHKYRKEKAVCYQDDIADCIYLVISGSLRKIRWREDETSVIINVVKQGDFIGLPEVISEATYLANVITEEETDLIKIGKSNFKKLLEMETIQQLIINELAKGYYQLYAQIDVYTPFQKIIKFLKSAALTFNKIDSVSKNYIIDITQENLAESISVTRETVGKYLRQLQDNGIISLYRGKIEILDIQKISNMSL